jgi:hypothetical protein
VGSGVWGVGLAVVVRSVCGTEINVECGMLNVQC